MDNPTQLPKIAVTPDEAARVTGRTRTRIFEALKNGEIAGRKDGKAVIIEVPELQRWIRTFPIRDRDTNRKGMGGKPTHRQSTPDEAA